MTDFPDVGPVRAGNPFDDFDANRIATEIVVQGEAYATAKRKSQYLAKMREPTLARMILNIRTADPSISATTARMMAMASPEYERYLYDLTAAEEKANLHYARREAARALHEGKRTEEASRRAALYGRH